MSLSPELLAVLRCPESRQPLSLAPADILESVNRDRADAPLEGGLLREDGTILYPIIDGFPILLVSEAIQVPSDS